MPRLPRFERATLRDISLTDRDCEIIQLVHRHRFLRSTHILALIVGSRQQLLRRLQLLFHHGYLTRPRAQIESYGPGGSEPMVYGLGNKGAKLLKSRFGIPLPHARWNEKNQSVRRIFLTHALVLSDVMVALELSARAHPDIALSWRDDFYDGAKRRPWRWQVRVDGKLSLGLIPDRVFSIEANGSNGISNHSFLFLEADRGTTPVIRKNLAQTSIYRKFIAYHATWRNGIHKSRFGFHRFRVLIVTTSAARTKKLIEACQKLESGVRLFLFCDQLTLRNHPDIFSAPWKDGRGDPATLLP